MKGVGTLLFFITLFTIPSFAQEPELLKRAAVYPEISYLFHVLKSDGKTEHGEILKVDRNANVLERGYYNHGKKDSTWTVYLQPGNILVSKGNYKDDRKVGVWKFYHRGKLQQKYDYDLKEPVYFLADTTTLTLVLDGADTLKTQCDRPVMFIGGDSLLKMQVRKYRILPPEAKEHTFKGVVLVELMVDSLGNATNHKVVGKTSFAWLDASALNAVKMLPNDWIPAVLGGKKVNAIYVVPVKYDF